jgi:hypothetical protein
LFLCAALRVQGQPTDGESQEVNTYNINGTACSETAQADEGWCSIWIMNTDPERGLYVEEDGELPLVNVEAVTVSDSDSPTTFTVYTSGIRNYRVTATQTLIDELNARPKAA